MTEEDDWLDKLLRANRATRVQDDGFTDSLMVLLPSRRPAALRWIIPAVTSIGAVLATIVSADHALFSAAQGLVDRQPFAAFALPIVLIWAGCAWAVSESS